MQLSDDHIERIASDIRAQGITDDSLQADLLDHICCVIEAEINEGEAVEVCYQRIIKKFYRNTLSEIQDETILLLNNKNYYKMKKTMVISGITSAAFLSAGILFKYMRWPAAGALITLGIGMASLIFLPLIATLKIKEQRQAKDRLLIAVGALAALSISLAIMFKVQHWPGANLLGVLSPAILALVFLPVYFFSGIRQPETRVNTIVSSMLIIIGCGLFFSLTATPRAIEITDSRNTVVYLRSEQILKQEWEHIRPWQGNDSSLPAKIYHDCERLKHALLLYALGSEQSIKQLPSGFVLIRDANTQDYLLNNAPARQQLQKTAATIAKYNESVRKDGNSRTLLPDTYTVFNPAEIKVRDKVTDALSDIIQLQMLLLQNEYHSGDTAQHETPIP